MPLPPELHSNWSTLSQLLDEALTLAPESRAAFVDSLSGERAQFRDTLRQLLEGAEGVETSDFMATLPQFTQAAEGSALADLACGDTIGPYRLLNELGTGGMGSVWLAERADGKLKRKVALKLPRLTWARGLAERMGRERDILASLEHPYIARLYDAGLDHMGRPYLALEYVEGQPIDVYAQKRDLSVRQRLDLLLQVCAAVAFAHSRLVVHRDLKPSNILVTADGQVRLLDFGIAKLMEGDSANETQLTQLAGRALTPDYASPEQIKGEPIGTASDVYSLGVVAFELLTERRPYRLKRGMAAEIEEAIASIDAPRASEMATKDGVKRSLRGDLDAVLSKALKKDPTRRYSSVDGLAQDIENYLRSMPVSARPDSFGYRARKVLVKYRVQAVAACAVFLSLIAGASVSLWQATEAQRQRDAAFLAADRAEQVKAFMLAIFQDADGAIGSGTTPDARDLLMAAAQRLSSRPLNDAVVTLELRQAIAYSLNGLGAFTAALKALEGLRDQALAVLGPHPITVTIMLTEVEALLGGPGSGKEAVPLVNEAVQIARRSGLHTQLAIGLIYQATLASRLEDVDRSLTLAREAVAVSEKLSGEETSLVRYRAYASLSAALDSVGKQADALEAAELALGHAKAAYPGEPNGEVLWAMRVRATALGNVGREREAVAELQVVADGQRRKRLDLKLAQTVIQMGHFQVNLGLHGEAAKNYAEATAIYARLGESVSDSMAIARMSTTSALIASRDAANALASAELALVEVRTAFGVQHSYALSAELMRATALVLNSRYAEAEAAFAGSRQRAMAHAATKPGWLLRFARLRLAQGRWAEAEGNAREALAILGEKPSLASANLQAIAGIALTEQGKVSEATTILHESVRQFERLQSVETPDTADARLGLARALSLSGDRSEALRQVGIAETYLQSRAGFDIEAERASILRRSIGD